MPRARRIKLSKGKFARVDADIFEEINKFKWYASLESRGTKWYAIRRVTVGGKRVKVRMHRLIMGLGHITGPDVVVDHLNHDSLDNRMCNLEIVTQKENMHCSPGWRGSRAFREKKNAA